MPPLLTVAIPAYSRPEDLRALLDTILAHAPADFDVLAVEACSLRQAEIRAVPVADQPKISVPARGSG